MRWRRAVAAVGVAAGSVALSITTATATAPTGDQEGRHLPLPDVQYHVVWGFPYSRVLPPIPDAVPGWTVSRQGRITMRVPKASGWVDVPTITAVAAFPSKACARFLWAVRWRVTNPDVAVLSGSKDFDDGEHHATNRAGGTGYITGFACDSPALKVRRVLNGSTATGTRVHVQYRIWVPAH